MTHEKKKCDRVCVCVSFFLPCVAVSQRFWAWRMPMLIFCFDCCSSTFKKPIVVRMVGAYFCLTGLLPLLLWRRHDDDHDDAHVTTILELIIWRRHDDDYDDAHVTTILELIIWALSSTHSTHTHTHTHTQTYTLSVGQHQILLNCNYELGAHNLSVKLLHD